MKSVDAFSQIRPSVEMLELMKGKTIPIEVEPGKTINLVSEGGGLLGLKTREENDRWAGWLNHYAITARVATFLARELQAKGVDIDPQLVLDGTLAVHLGRRQFQEAIDYPEYVEDAEEKKAGGSDATGISLRLLKQRGMSPRISELVKANSGAGEEMPTFNRIEEKVVLIADLMVSQEVMSLKGRFSDLKERGRIPEDSPLETLALSVQSEVFSQLDVRPEDLTDEYPTQPEWERELRAAYKGDAIESLNFESRETSIDISNTDRLIAAYRSRV